MNVCRLLTACTNSLCLGLLHVVSYRTHFQRIYSYLFAYIIRQPNTKDIVTNSLSNLLRSCQIRCSSLYSNWRSVNIRDSETCAYTRSRCLIAYRHIRSITLPIEVARLYTQLYNSPGCVTAQLRPTTLLWTYGTTVSRRQRPVGLGCPREPKIRRLC